MKQLITIAWRNVWRNKLRSTVVILSIVLGLWGGLFMMGLALGLNEQRLNSAINSSLAHVQIHHPKFEDDYNKKYTLVEGEKIKKQLQEMPFVSGFSERFVLPGLAATSKGNYGIKILGITPEQEQLTTDISTRLIEGTYFTTFKNNPILVGQKLAEQLGLKVQSKVVLSFQDKDNQTISKSFRVEAIYKTANSMYDQLHVFVSQEDLASLIGIREGGHELLIKCKSLDDAPKVQSVLKTSNLVQRWDQRAPELGYAQQIMGSFMYIFIGIILMALAFGIINTMLMAILERQSELGMLMSIGMNKFKIFSMIVMETLFLVVFALPMGMILAQKTIGYFSTQGIDLSIVAKGLENVGLEAVIYPFLTSEYYFNITIMTTLVALVSGLIPARRALKINPAEAVKVI
jgi:putative ABC transport system permease protein